MFSQPDIDVLAACDVVFFATPNGTAMRMTEELLARDPTKARHLGKCLAALGGREEGLEILRELVAFPELEPVERARAYRDLVMLSLRTGHLEEVLELGERFDDDSALGNQGKSAEAVADYVAIARALLRAEREAR